ncbi:MAG: hypothetical protein ABW072_12150, partial [Sedimenticola sp.]
MVRKFLASVCLLGMSFAANASLIGDTIHFAQNYSTLGSEHFATDPVVGPGIEGSYPNVYTVDVSASSILVTFLNSASFIDVPDTLPSFNGPVVSGLDDSSGDPLTGIDNFATNVASFSIDDVHILSGSSIGFNLDGKSFTTGHTIYVDL